MDEKQNCLWCNKNPGKLMHVAVKCQALDCGKVDYFNTLICEDCEKKISTPKCVKCTKNRIFGCPPYKYQVELV